MNIKLSKTNFIGVLFTDKINPLKKRLLKGKLNDIAKGNIKVKYRMKFPLIKAKGY